jgi:ABC-type polysaccharide/polyol phosphate export permease
MAPTDVDHSFVTTGHRSVSERLVELWQYRHLVGNLVIRDLKVRYKNSALGFLWSLVSPLLMMVVFWLVFSYFMAGPTTPANYHVFVLVAILPWNWFSAAVSGGIFSIVNNSSLINKVYFPREVLPTSIVTSELINFLLAIPVLFLIIVLSGIPLTPYALWLPVVISIQLVFTMGIVLILATANVYYRDTGMIMDVVLLAWFFLTPIIYDIERFRFTYLPVIGMSAEKFMYYVNPMASLVATYRVILYGSHDAPPGPPAFDFLFRTAVTALIVLVVGYWLFQRYSHRFGEDV